VTLVVGDVHGHRHALVELLRGAGVLDAAERWVGGDTRLWLTGDLVDRGPDGLATVDLVMRLEREADVHCLLGNHEAMLLAADRHGAIRVPGLDLTFGELWTLNGGRPADRARLTDAHRGWLSALPAVAREGRWLLLHADTVRYLELGSSVEEVCAATRAALLTHDVSSHAAVLEILSDRGGLTEDEIVDRLLGRLGGERVVHGHTPIALVLGVDAAEVRRPLVSADGRVTNVDHCLFGGGPGFVLELESL
jgi:hypothetical protein